MPVVHRSNSPLEAREAAMFLRRNGIKAVAIGSGGHWGGVGPGAEPYQVVVDDPAQAATAGELLARWKREPERPDPGWEQECRPDLSRADPRLVAPCPACYAPLPLDAGAALCPACGAAADPVEALIARYGPEVLADCYPSESAGWEGVDDSVLAAAGLVCPSCRYSLRGLANVGLCPECGGPYNKRQILKDQDLL